MGHSGASVSACHPHGFGVVLLSELSTAASGSCILPRLMVLIGAFALESASLSRTVDLSRHSPSARVCAL